MKTEMNKLMQANKQAMETMKDLGEINFKLATALTQQQLDLMGIYLEGGVKQMKALSLAKDAQSLVESQAGLAEEMGKKVLGNINATMEVLVGAKNQWTDWTAGTIEAAAKAA